MPAAPQPRMHGITHVPGGPDPIPGLQLSPSAAFFDAMMEIAATRDLRGYWRLGDGGGGPYADSSDRPTPVPMTVTGSGVAPTDLDEGALPAPYDDGAVYFTPDADDGSGAQHLHGANNWGTGDDNPFEIVEGTVAGWVRTGLNTNPAADSFAGSVFSMMAIVAGSPDHPQGYSLSVDWPSGGLTAGVPFVGYGTSRLYGPLLEAGTWYFLCGVNDGTAIRLYINGALVATGAYADWEPGTNMDPVIGKFTNEGVLVGAVDEVSVWADPLTSDEIQQLAAAGGVADEPGFRSVVNTDAAYTAHPGETVLANGTFTVTLPTAAGNLGAEITVKNVAAGTITVGRTGSQEIEGAAANQTLAALDAHTYVSDGAGWWIVSTGP